MNLNLLILTIKLVDENKSSMKLGPAGQLKFCKFGSATVDDEPKNKSFVG